jgi:HSP20 family protein
MFGDLIPRAWTRDRSFTRELTDLHRGLDTLFDDVFGPPQRSTSEREPARSGAWWPAIEGHMKDGALVVRADLPGVDPQHVEVSLDGDTLRISGERKVEEQKEEQGARYSEVRYGRFERTLTVPEGLDPEKITARYTNGVLEVTAPLPEARTPRKVQIEVGGAAPESGGKKAA